MVSPGYAGKLSKTRTDCAFCYCTHFRVERLSKPSTAAKLTKTPGRTLFHRPGLGRTAATGAGNLENTAIVRSIRSGVEKGRG
jgi:hypothetical protein